MVQSLINYAQSVSFSNIVLTRGWAYRPHWDFAAFGDVTSLLLKLLLLLLLLLLSVVVNVVCVSANFSH